MKYKLNEIKTWRTKILPPSWRRSTKMKPYRDISNHFKGAVHMAIDLLVKRLSEILPTVLLLFTIPTGIARGENPCDDKMYLDLREMDIDSMSERQYQYFIQKDKLCTEHSVSEKDTAPSDVLGQPDHAITKEIHQSDMPAPSSGWVKITVNSDDIKLFIDGESYGKGNKEVQLPAGVHKIVAKTETSWQTELVEVFKNDISSISFDLDSQDSRNVRFFMSFDASWMLGDGIEFGPSHMVGLEIQKKHLIALNYYWGLPVFSEEIYGGGVQYMYTFNIHDIFLVRLGGGAGFWYEWHDDWDYYDDYYDDYDNYWENFYFGGPKVRFEVGYKHVYFVIADATCLLGTSVKAMLTSGISFRF